MELINLELEVKFDTKKKLTPNTYSKQASNEKQLAPYDFKLATMLDPRFKLDCCQNDESHDVCDLLTSQVMQLSPKSTAGYLELL